MARDKYEAGKANWTPVPVPPDLRLPDPDTWPIGTSFPYHPLGRPTHVYWFPNSEGTILGGECRFEIDAPAEHPSGTEATASDTPPSASLLPSADATDVADPNFLHPLAAIKKKKEIRPLVYCRRGDRNDFAWRWQGLSKPYPLFDLPYIVNEIKRPVLITEGARKAVSARALFPDFATTAMLFGAKAPEKSDCAPLAGRDCTIWPDHDAAGLEFARKIASLLHRAGAASVRMVNIPASFPSKWDLCDPIPDTITVDDLHRLLNAAEPMALPSASGNELADALDDNRSSDEPGGDLLAGLVDRARTDVGAPFEDRALRQLAELRSQDHAAFVRLRSTLKTSAKVPIAELDKALTAVARQCVDIGEDEKKNQATLLVDLAINTGVELFHNALIDGYMSIQIEQHTETWTIRGKSTKNWLTKLYFDFTARAPNSEALQAAVNVLDAKAQFEGPELTVHLRVGEQDGRLYLDLCDPAWRAVEIDANGWRIISNPPIRFRRTSGMLLLPEPTRGGSVKTLGYFLNVGTRDATGGTSRFVLAVAWLLAAFNPRGPYPILALSGEQGTAKSSFVKVLRGLIDPNIAALRTLSRNDQDLFIAANNGRIVGFDNVSRLPDWLSDSLCRLATGGAFATRRLYTDGSEVLFNATRPIILNGIEDFVLRPDLADRSILLTLDVIPPSERRAETEFWNAFETERPQILGAFLDAVAHGLKMLPEVHLEGLPRMADFAIWATACEGTLWPAGTFMAAYDANRDAAAETVLEADAVAMAVLSMMSKKTSWQGTATQLLAALDQEITEAVKRERKWPKNGQALSGRLRRAQPGLRECGITVERDREGKGRTRKLRISRVAADPGNLASAASAPSAAAGESGDISEIEQKPGGQFRAGADGDRVRNQRAGTRPADTADGTDASLPAFSGPCSASGNDENATWTG